MSTADIIAFAALALAVGGIIYRAGKFSKDVDAIGAISRRIDDKGNRRYLRLIAFLQRTDMDDKERESEIAKLIREDRID